MTELSPSPPPDLAIPAACPVTWADAMAKAVVRAAAQDERWSLWQRFSAEIEDAKDAARSTGIVLPWEDQEAVTEIEWSRFQRVLESVISTISPVPERQRLLRAAHRAYEELAARGAGARPIKSTRYGIKRCSRDGCPNRFAARSFRHIYCSERCRVGAYVARQRANGQASENVTGKAPGTPRRGQERKSMRRGMSPVTRTR